MSGAERSKPFVAMLNPRTMTYHSRETSGCAADGCYPAVVTPLLPDDPRPGDRMEWTTARNSVTVVTPPFLDAGGVSVGVVYDDDPEVYLATIARLRRPPVLKTFRLETNVGDWRLGPCSVEVRAESKEAALAKLAESLEEIP